MRKLNITPSMWEIASIAFVCMAIVAMLSWLLGFGNDTNLYLAATSVTTATICLPTRNETT